MKPPELGFVGNTIQISYLPFPLPVYHRVRKGYFVIDMKKRYFVIYMETSLPFHESHFILLILVEILKFPSNEATKIYKNFNSWRYKGINSKEKH